VTIKEYFAKRRCWSVALCISGFTMIPLGFFLTVWDTRLIFVLIGGFGLFAFGLIYGSDALCCPQCGGSWRALAARGFQPLLDKKVRFCPYCGYRIETESREGEIQVGQKTTDERITIKTDIFLPGKPRK
jgi:hypothetical protein